MTQDPCPAEFIALAERLADAAGAAVRPYFRTAMNVDAKADLTPVTIADREAELAMRALIEATYPEHGILGEEFGAVRADADYIWILDPIDGTKSFITGLPLFGTLIALVRRRVALLGVIDQPISRERWLGARGRTSALNARPIATRACAALDRAALFTTTSELFHGAEAEAYGRLRQKVNMSRLTGDCYAFGLLAAGHADLAIEARVQPHDYAALIAVIEGAGGVITDWEGRALDCASPARLLAAGDARAHRAALDCLQG